MFDDVSNEERRELKRTFQDYKEVGRLRCEDARIAPIQSELSVCPVNSVINGDMCAMRTFITTFLALFAFAAVNCGFGEIRTDRDVSAADRLQIQEIIGAQLRAFHSQNAEKAFSYASPSMQEKFRTPARFLSMVRRFWPEVYSARRSEFLQLAEIKGVWIQGVVISDDLGETWLAQYPMELQPDGHWLIDGCVVRALEDRSL